MYTICEIDCLYRLTRLFMEHQSVSLGVTRLCFISLKNLQRLGKVDSAQQRFSCASYTAKLSGSNAACSAGIPHSYLPECINIHWWIISHIPRFAPSVFRKAAILGFIRFVFVAILS